MPPASTSWSRAPRAAACATCVALLACGSEPAAIVASGRVDRELGPAPLRVCFEGAAPAAGGLPVSLAWDFGDGSPRSPEPYACHTYAEPGSYAASVEATDAAGRSSLAVVIVTASAP